MDNEIRAIIEEAQQLIHITNLHIFRKIAAIWIERSFRLAKTANILEIKNDVVKLSVISYHKYLQNYEWGHSYNFALTVATTIDPIGGLINAYRNLSSEQRYEEAYNEYESKGHSPIFCHKIATKISDEQSLNRYFFENIEATITMYEEAFKSMLNMKRPIWQAYIYAESFSESEIERADEVLNLIDKGCFKLSDYYKKHPDKFYELILGRKFIVKMRDGYATYDHTLILSNDIFTTI